MVSITPFLWFHERAEEAADFYVSLFPDSRVLRTVRATDPIPDADPGSVLIIEFELNGQRIVAMNGGPTFTLDEAFSLAVEVETQEEVDRLWDALTADGGEPSRCGWLRDRWGLSWQITPAVLNRLMADPDPARAAKAAASMMTMGKIDIATLLAAVDAD